MLRLQRDLRSGLLLKLYIRMRNSCTQSRRLRIPWQKFIVRRSKSGKFMRERPAFRMKRNDAIERSDDQKRGFRVTLTDIL